MEQIDNKYERAVARVIEIRKFYGKVAKFTAFILIVTALHYFTGWISSWVYIVAGFWALGLILNAFKLFGPNLIFGAGWENRMIEREMRKPDDNIFHS